ncbi:adult-specific rigid cuticular protein 15.7-like [Oppia nitens]|uniref:adult-specific rigid cuticular protein 15.7-like n=1 Tax=Oppia nitens TaxID=1686743 RepID=UPI0023DA3F09|nr:adult-specific rigid cuticular protein 15.7-like [Oppia nitens]
MKVSIVLCAFVGVSLASPLLELQSYGKAVNTGRSQVTRKDDGHGNYEFAYDEEHHTGGTSRREKGGKGWQTGSYELRDRDGRKRTVKYVADAHGFRAQVDTNEPGVDAKEDPADVSINKNGYSQLQLAQPVYIAKSEPQIISYAAPKLISYDSGLNLESGKSWASGYDAQWSGPSIESSGHGYSKW